MPRYTVTITVLADESGMARECTAATEDEAAAETITYFEDGGNGPIAGMTESTPRGSTDNGDYSVTVDPFGERPA